MNHDQPVVPVEAQQALRIARQCLADTLVAAYLHGSAVAGGLRTGSDVDILVVVDRPTTGGVRKRLAAELMTVSGRHPARSNAPRPLELIVFLRGDLATARYPMRGEFVYGEWLREAFEAGAVPESGFDPEFTLLLAQARKEARTLIGPELAGLVSVIPRSDITRAIEDALPALLDTLEGDAGNVLLTLARMWRTLETGEFVPKDVAAGWAAARLPAGTAAATVASALEAYLGSGVGGWQFGRPEARQAAAELYERVRAALKPPSG